MVKGILFQKKLDNGMKIILEKRPGEVVSIAFAVRHGGAQEDLNEKGISHFIEHLLYKGTSKRNSKQISEEIEKKGGVLNGFTDEEITAYWCKLPKNYLGVGLDVLSDMIKNPLFDEKEIEKERKVIFEEMVMRSDNPQIHVLDKIQGFLYKGSLGKDLIGTKESLRAINRQMILDKFKKAYSTNNLILCVVGNADFDFLCDFAQKTFKRTCFDIKTPKVELKNQEMILNRKGLDQANLVFAYHVPFGFSEGSYSAKVLSVILGGGMSSRLFQEVREKRNLAYSIRASSNIGNVFGFNLVYAGTKKENVEKVKNLIIEEIKKLKDLDKKELDSIKEQIIGNEKISKEDSQGQMINLLYSEINGNVEEAYSFNKKINQVQLKDVRDLAKNSLKSFSFYALIPE